MSSSEKFRYGSPVFTLALHLFRRYATEEELDTEEMEKVTIQEFYEWGTMQTDLFPDREELKEFYDLEDDTEFDQIEKFFSSPFVMCEAFAPWWTVLTLSSRRRSKYTPVMASLTFCVYFDDGQVAKIETPFKAPIKDGVSDGLLLAVWQTQIQQVESLIRENGIDFLYDESCNNDNPNTSRTRTISTGTRKIVRGEEFENPDIDSTD